MGTKYDFKIYIMLNDIFLLISHFNTFMDCILSRVANHSRCLGSVSNIKVTDYPDDAELKVMLESLFFWFPKCCMMRWGPRDCSFGTKTKGRSSEGCIQGVQ